jgi:hypothetical protein
MEMPGLTQLQALLMFIMKESLSLQPVEQLDRQVQSEIQGHIQSQLPGG